MDQSVSSPPCLFCSPRWERRSDSPLRWIRCSRESSRSRMASAIVGSPSHACQCSTGSCVVRMVARDRVPARSSMISSRSARAAGSSGASAQSSSTRTSVRASATSHSEKPPLPCRIRSSSARRGSKPRPARRSEKRAKTFVLFAPDASVPLPVRLPRRPSCRRARFPHGADLLR